MVLRINTSIARKLVFQAVVISLFTIVITMVITLESTKDIILQQTSDQLQDEATISGISIQNILDSRETHAHILANEFEIKQLVLKLNSTKYESTIDSDKMFLSYMTEFESVIKNAEIDNIIISDGMGKVLFSLDRRQTSNISEESRFLRAISGDNFAEFGASVGDIPDSRYESST